MTKDRLERFYRGKRVFITGHTGFKGSWLCKLLLDLGAVVYGYALEAPTEPSVFEILDLKNRVHSVIGDVRDPDALKEAFDAAQPEIVFHLAAQPLVRESYLLPRYTYETNVMGTVNLCECIRNSACVKSFLNVTTDKVYENNELEIPFTEDMPLDGYDPYSNSKSCSELVTHCYKKSFFNEMNIAVSTARAGNVIGGGDFAKDRIVPDCVRAAAEGKEIILRNPYAIRPFQHVLEPLYVYLIIAKAQYLDPLLQGYYNVGPDVSDCITTGRLADIFCRLYGEGAKWKSVAEKNAPHEAGFLKLNTDKVKSAFGWKPVWNIETALKSVVDWSKAYAAGEDMDRFMTQQINGFWENINA
ncbi:MAG: CDP-glucose 4,6-dehydratase [Eubacterium sp.]|nr:CDP-glucose 4,6-dehydratase [Eubacterium sp.]